MPQALAIANNDVTQIVWRYEAAIAGCLGFAVYRKEGAPDDAGDWHALPAWVGFQGGGNAPWQPKTTEIWPVQKFNWKDLTATRGKTYSYRVVPATNPPDADGKLTLLDAQAVTAGPVTLTENRGVFRTYFNRGILSTQFLVHQLPQGPSGAPNYTALGDHIDTPGDALRLALAGQILEGVTLLLHRAATQGGTIYAALYELADPELVQLLANASALQLILSNTGSDDTENAAARTTLHAAPGATVLDRFVPSGHIGHNKFCIYVDTQGVPQAVLLGSTNWTDTALCAQSNNALVVESPALAAAYMAYWKRLQTDTDDAGSKQAAELRDANAQPGATDLPVDEGFATLLLSPNTPHARKSPAPPDEAVPPDLQMVFGLMDQAKQAILFLEFEPGSPSVVDHAAACANANPTLLVRGAVTDPKAADSYETTLIHRPGEDTATVIPATEVRDQFSYWQKELLKAGPMAHAIVHSKIVVIDPMSPDCVVITGSHNHGYRASYNNDENLLIVRGHAALAQAYAVNVLDAYDHYRFRYLLQKQGDQAFSGLDPTDAWQNKYFDSTNPASNDINVWLPLP